MQLEHIHPMIVHFPIVLVVLALLADSVNALAGKGEAVRGPWANAGLLLALGAGVMGLAAFFLGDMAYDIAVERGVPEALLEDHEGWGTMTAMALAAVALLRLFFWWRQMPKGGAYRGLTVLLSLASVALVFGTAYFGGDLVYVHGVNIIPTP